MRVLVWSSAFWPHVGGVEVLGAHFTQGLRERGHEVLVVADLDQPGMASAEDVGGVPVRRIPVRAAIAARGPSAILRAGRDLAALRAEFRPDLDHVFFFGPELPLVRAARRGSTAGLVVSLHVYLHEALAPAGSAVGQTLREADWVVACSDSVLADTRRLIPELERSSAIVNAVPPAAGESAPTPAEPTLLFLGRLNVQKGFDLGLEAFAKVAVRHPRARVVIAGDGDDRDMLERLAGRLGLGDRVTFTGWATPAEVPGLIDAATIVVMPSRFEPYGLVAMEAGQRSRPVIAFAVDGLPEAVADGQTGLLAPPGDVEALAAALERLLSDPALAQRLGRQGRQRAAGADRWRRHLDEYEEVFRRALDRARAGSPEPLSGTRRPARPRP
jgi:glycogen synthase